MEETLLISKLLATLDTDGLTSMAFYKSSGAFKYGPIIKIIREQINYHYFANNPYSKSSGALNARLCYILTYLGQHFNEYCWPCHEVHFHTTFEQYIACPFTTLTELTEFFKKI